MSDSDVHVRLAGLGDAVPLSRLSGALFPLGCPRDTEPDDLADYINRELTPDRFLELLNDPSIVVLLAAIRNELAGYALIARTEAPALLRSSAGSELRKFYVDSQYHGRGIAGILMKEVLRIAQERQNGKVWLSVFSGNERAIAFYQKWGFQIAGTQEFLVGSDRQRDYLMQHEAAVSMKVPE
jgi:ribosomal protein S18 acetylase RimI-like enzyme